MKKFFLTIIALVGAVAGYAQISDGVTATLQVGDNTTVFYGFDAFKDALAAAPDADGVITLSPGAFSNPGAISKSIKIYGAGFIKDVVNNISETRVNGNLTITSTDALAPVVRIEGVYFVNDLSIGGTQAVSKTEIIKCSFGHFCNDVETNSTIIRQSYIRGALLGRNKLTTGLVVANCWIGDRIGSEKFATGSSGIINHCIIAYYYAGSYGSDYYPFDYRNNIFNYCSNNCGAGSTCYNNVGWEAKFSNGGQNTSSGNYDVALWTDWKTLFADGQDNLEIYIKDTTTPRTWELADPTTYVGIDGTPCGVTGGDFPWNPIPATPRIFSTSVDAKTTPGTLKVSVKAEARPLE